MKSSKLLHKRFCLFLLYLMFPALMFSQISGYDVGDTVDDFTVTDINGITHNLYSITAQGKYVYLDFSYTQCGPCQTAAPVFNEFYDTYGCNAGDVFCLLICGVNGDTDNEVVRFENNHGGDFQHAPAVSTEGGAVDVHNSFNPDSTPTVCVIGPDNKVVDTRVYPITGIADYVNDFPEGFNPSTMPCSTSAISEYDMLPKVILYPNPLPEGTPLKFSFPVDTDGHVRVNIYNFIGQLVNSQSLVSEKQMINADLKQGVYMVEFMYQELVFTEQLIVK